MTDNKRPDEWQCYKILHAGEGERGEDVLVIGVWTPEHAAQKAAAYFDQLEIQREHTVASDYNGTTQWIEVETSDGPRRFVVRCKVVRMYEAQVIAEEGRNGRDDNRVD